jgi:hypothetical protein
MNRENPLVDTSVLIDYFEGIDCRESAGLDKPPRVGGLLHVERNTFPLR